MKLQFKQVVIGAALGLMAITAHSEEVTLRAVSVFAKDSFFDRKFEAFVKKVNDEGKGIVQINMLGGPEAMPPFEVGNAVRAGVVDMANTTGVFHANLVPEALVMSFSSTPMAQVRSNGGYELMDQIHREKANMTWLGRIHDGLKYHVYTTKKLEGGSFEGMKLRSVPVYRTFFQSLGALPLQVPPGEVYTALERGMVDGYGWPSVGIFDLGWQEKTSYRIDPGFYNVEVSVFMNKNSWDKKLDDAQRAFLQDQIKQLEARYGEDDELAEKEKQQLIDTGIEIITLDSAQAEAFVAKADEAAWNAIDQASPRYAPQLRELFGNAK